MPSQRGKFVALCESHQKNDTVIRSIAYKTNEHQVNSKATSTSSHGSHGGELTFYPTWCNMQPVGADSLNIIRNAFDTDIGFH